jgi:threonine dehydratase
MSKTVTPQDIAARIPAAAKVIAGAVHRTPLEPSTWLSDVSGAYASLKLECYQPTGSFKVRGAVTAMAELDVEALQEGVITASAGNHGLGIAHAAQRLGIKAAVVVPEDASPAKVHALERFPIELVMRGIGYEAAERAGRALAAETGAIFVSAYNDPAVIAGQGTIGPELLEDEPNLDAVLVPVGGGGVISGIGAWLKAVRPTARVIGVQSEASPAMAESLRAGQLVPVPDAPSLADGLSGNIEPGSITFDLARHVVDEMVRVDEAEIAAAIAQTFQEMSLVVEGAGAVGIAALLNGRIADLAGKSVAVIVTGRNIAAERLLDLLTTQTNAAPL